ncbi:MAG TPA: type II toxin-antitoxin system death-on-curing family toxin [Planctomycetia bacterium]|nr:type II toxin-antitoxin system death-on-curing family toxin [Planctomycetia bacterium]
MVPLFPTREEVLALHEIQIARYGGVVGLRDPAGFDSALAQPQSTFADSWLHADLFEMAAAYLYHLARNHPFLDGNKRIGAATAIVFLEMNGIDVSVDVQELVDLVLAVARGEADKLTVAAFFRGRAAT